MRGVESARVCYARIVRPIAEACEIGRAFVMAADGRASNFSCLGHLKAHKIGVRLLLPLRPYSNPTPISVHQPTRTPHGSVSSVEPKNQQKKWKIFRRKVSVPITPTDSFILHARTLHHAPAAINTTNKPPNYRQRHVYLRNQSSRFGNASRGRSHIHACPRHLFANQSPLQGVRTHRLEHQRAPSLRTPCKRHG